MWCLKENAVRKLCQQGDVNQYYALHFDEHVKQLEQVRNSSQNAVDELLGQFDIVSNDLQSLKAGVLYELEKYYHNSWKIFEEFRASKVWYCLQNLEQRQTGGSLPKKH